MECLKLSILDEQYKTDKNVSSHKELTFNFCAKNVRSCSFNAKELDETSGLYYYGARYYDPNGTFISRDELFEEKPYMSPYAYCDNNPVCNIDPDGRWVFSVISKANAGVGVGVGISGAVQSGVAYDKYGKSRLLMSQTNYLTDVNSNKPNVMVGAEASLTKSVSYDWKSRSFVESASSPNTSTSFSAKGVLGGEIGYGESSATLGVGVGLGIAFSMNFMSISYSVSLTDAEAAKVDKMSGGSFWGVENVSPMYNDNGRITGYSGSVYTHGAKGEKISTGIPVKCGAAFTNDSKTTLKPNNIWVSEEYNSAIK